MNFWQKICTTTTTTTTINATKGFWPIVTVLEILLQFNILNFYIFFFPKFFFYKSYGDSSLTSIITNTYFITTKTRSE